MTKLRDDSSQPQKVILLVLIFIAIIMATFVDHYAVLGVTSTATAADIKKAYRQLALQHHPDKTAPAGKVDAAKFISAQAAYEILVDVTKRKAYDIQYNKSSKTDHASRFKHQQARRAARVPVPKRETDGSYGGWYVPEWISRGRETVIEEDDPDSDYEGSGYKDSGVYEDGYEDPHYKPYRTCTSKGIVSESLDNDNYGIYTNDFDSASAQYHFPVDFADDFDFAPAQGSDGDLCGDGGEGQGQSGDDYDPTLQISEPLSEAFDAFTNMSKSHYLEEKVLGRYYSKHKSCSPPRLRLSDLLSFGLLQSAPL